MTLPSVCPGGEEAVEASDGYGERINRLGLTRVLYAAARGLLEDCATRSQAPAAAISRAVENLAGCPRQNAG
jgi:hypothetical protein